MRFLLGYAHYGTVHYLAHRSRPKRGLGRLLRELDMRHHFRDDGSTFGVGAPYWGVVFRTTPEGFERGARLLRVAGVLLLSLVAAAGADAGEEEPRQERCRLRRSSRLTAALDRALLGGEGSDPAPKITYLERVAPGANG